MIRLLVLSALGLLGCSVIPKLDPVRPADAIVVLGNRPPVDERGRVRPETRRRVEAGVELYRRGMAPLMVMTGGDAGGVIEAEVMRDLATTLGVPAKAILVEPRSDSTITNARNSVRLLRRHLKRRRCSVIVVSSPYHLARARRLFQCAGAEVQIAATEVPDSTAYRVGFTGYEIFVRGIYLFMDECKRARGEPDETSYSGIL